MRAFRIAYDGRHYNGFQRQPSVPTVEDALLDALREQGALGPAEAVDTPPEYAAAGRTDAGVSAIAQTIAFDAPDWLTPRALNGALPGGVRAWAAADVPEDFHATHHATRRTYRYYLFAPPVGGSDASGVESTADPTSLPAPSVDDERVHTALGKLSGQHDFANFTTDEAGTERDVTATATRSGPFLVLDVSAGGFPREFVRRLVTLVRAVGTGDASLAKVDRALDPEPLPGHEGIGPAPPEPLVLWDVAYEATPAGVDESVDFAVDEEARESALQAFGERHVSARVDTRVLGAMREGLGADPG
ncbi:MAG: tRNA pseudouridine(38-40) synthase TruA [Halopenitus sp.]